MVSDDWIEDFRSFDDAVQEIKHRRETELAILGEIGDRKKNRAIERFWIGGIVGHLQAEAEYGDAIMERITNEVGVSETYLRESRIFYDAHDGSEQACRAWMDQVEKERGQVNWSHCRNWARKKLSGDDFDEDQQKVEDETRRIERRAEKLSQDVREMEEQVMQSNADEETKAEALGAAAKARQVAEDALRTSDRLELDEYDTTESKKWRRMVTQVQCFACGKVGSREDMHPHHLERAGQSLKVPDTEVGPLCSTCHDRLHDMPEQEFWQQMGVNPWKQLVKEILSPALQHLDLDELANHLEPYFRTRNQ
jgi:hypothetical protein